MGYKQIKKIPGRGLCGLQEFIFTVGLIHDFNEIGYGGRWCYPKERAIDAFIALEIWDGVGDPPGPWIKYKGTEEYSNPKLTKNEESVVSSCNTNQSKNMDLELKEGDSVHYVRDNHEDKPETFENGIVKRVHPDGGKAWVVYNCDNDWGNYKDYTAALTDYSNLRKGWV